MMYLANSLLNPLSIGQVRMKNYLLRRRILEFAPDNQIALFFPDLVITYIILEDDDARLVTGN